MILLRDLAHVRAKKT